MSITLPWLTNRPQRHPQSHPGVPVEPRPRNPGGGRGLAGATAMTGEAPGQRRQGAGATLCYQPDEPEDTYMFTRVTTLLLLFCFTPWLHAATVYFENFEAGIGGWSADNGVWEVGTPTTVGPTDCFGSNKCAGTVLNGNYPQGTVSRLVSPSIILPTLASDENLYLRFREWHEYYGSADRGMVQVSVYDPVAKTWSVWADASTTAVGYMSPVWSLKGVDLNAYAGKKVRLAFQHIDVCCGGMGAGWYLDDVTIVSKPAQFTGDFTTGWGDWYADNGVWQVGTPKEGPLACHGGTLCASTVPNGSWSSLIFPEYQLGTVAGLDEIHLRFWHWHGTGGAGQVYVSVYDSAAKTWSDWIKEGAEVGPTSGAWTVKDIDLTAYAGKKVRLEFHHYNGNANPGWYVDDVTISGGSLPTEITVELTSSANPAPFGQPITFTGAVRNAQNPTGKLNFSVDGSALAPCTDMPLTNASANCTASGLSAGNHAILARYSGDNINNAAQATLTQVIQAAPPGSYPLAVNNLNPGGGTVSSTPAGINCGTQCAVSLTANSQITLNAQPASGFLFNGWGGDCTGLNACVLTMNGAKNLTAQFIAIPTGYQYKLTAKAYAPFDDWPAAARQEFGPTAEVLDWNTIKTDFGGSVALIKWLMDEIGYSTRMQGGGRGVTVNGSQRWSGSRSYGIDRAEGTVPSGYLVHDQLQNNWVLLGSWPADRPVVVRIPISAPTFPLTVTHTDGGTVGSSPAGINCGPVCTSNFTEGTQVTLTAYPATGFNFTGWGGACSGTGACVVTMDGAKDVSAQFAELPKFPLTVTRAATGIVTSTPGGIDCGAKRTACRGEFATVTLTATPLPGYSFKQWVGCPGATGDTCALTLTRAARVQAQFLKIPSYAIKVTKNTLGTVTSAPQGLNCAVKAKNCAARFITGTTVTLTAQPVAGAVFVGWTGACTGNGVCVVTLNGTKKVTAKFQRASSAAWFGDWVQVNFLGASDNGAWGEDNPSGLGFVSRINGQTWTEIDDYGDGCAITYAYTIQANGKYAKKAVNLGDNCPPLSLPSLKETGKLQFAEENGRTFMYEYFTLAPGDDIIAFKWMRL